MSQYYLTDKEQNVHLLFNYLHIVNPETQEVDLKHWINPQQKVKVESFGETEFLLSWFIGIKEDAGHTTYNTDSLSVTTSNGNLFRYQKMQAETITLSSGETFKGKLYQRG
jgi:hypothetical protein